jgi:hypothetical protein
MPLFFGTDYNVLLEVRQPVSQDFNSLTGMPYVSLLYLAAYPFLCVPRFPGQVRGCDRWRVR